MSKGLIYVLDDDGAVRDSLVALLESTGREAVGFATADEFLARCSQHQPVCAIVDIRMPGVSGLELLGIMRMRQMSIPVVVITGHGDVHTAVQSMRLGAVDVLQKPFPQADLLKAIDLAYAPVADVVASKERLSVLPGHSDEVKQRLRSLSPREREILDLIVQGKSSRDIAALLSISVATVNNHRTQIKTKMNANTVAHLLSMMNGISNVA